MVNATSNLLDLLNADAGGAGKRANGGGRDGGISFAETLGGQMRGKSAGGQGADARGSHGAPTQREQQHANRAGAADGNDAPKRDDETSARRDEHAERPEKPTRKADDSGESERPEESRAREEEEERDRRDGKALPPLLALVPLSAAAAEGEAGDGEAGLRPGGEGRRDVLGAVLERMRSAQGNPEATAEDDGEAQGLFRRLEGNGGERLRELESQFRLARRGDEGSSADGQRQLLDGRGEGQGRRDPDALLRDLGQAAKLDTRTQSGGTQTQTGNGGTGTQNPLSSANTARSGGPNLQVSVPVNQKGWDQAMAQRVVWMARQGVQTAQIQMQPRHLGPVEVSVSVQNDQATVHFVAQNPQTREALDAAMPRLREMLQDNGFAQVRADVSDQSFQEQQRQAMGQGGGAGGGMSGLGGGNTEPGEDAVVTTVEVGLGAVDYYA